MLSLLNLFILGAIAGFTIFLGFPIAFASSLSDRWKGMLNAAAMGILLFLIVEVFSEAWKSTLESVTSVSTGQIPVANGVSSLLAMFGGLAVGLLGLVAYERRYLRKTGIKQTISGAKLSTMIAMGIGAHNLSEGLAIGQSYATGAIALALVLIIGFGVHNATEGFGIAAPLASLETRPNLAFVIRLGLIGGGPTFLGTIIGSQFHSTLGYILFLSLAGGALIYVTMMMYNAGRKQTANDMLMIGAFFGVCAGFLTDLIISLGGA